MPKKSSKYKYMTVGIDNLKPGEGIAFKLDKPWGLAAYIYKVYRPEHKGEVHVRVDKVNYIVYVWKECEWKVIDLN